MRRRPEPDVERWRRYGVRSEQEWFAVCEARAERRRRCLALLGYDATGRPLDAEDDG